MSGRGTQLPDLRKPEGPLKGVSLDPILVLLPGLDGTPTLFEPILRKLEVEVVTVSYP